MTGIFVAANGLVLFAAYATARRMRLSGALERVLALWTVYLALITATMLIAGVVLRSLTPATLLLLNVAAAAVLAVPTLRDRSLWPFRSDIASLAGTFRELRRDAWAASIVVLAAVAAVWTLVLVVVMPVFAWDSITYHMVTVAAWLQAGRIGTVPYLLWSNVYPSNAELFYAWIELFNRTDMLVDGAQVFYALGGILATAGLARAAGIGRAGSLAAGCFFLLTPIVLIEAYTNYVDIAIAALALITLYWIMAALRSGSSAHFLLAGLAAGLTLGTKQSGVIYAGVLFLTLVGGLVRQRRTGATALLRPLLLFALPAVLLGGFWYARTWILYGSPVYPFTVSVLGHTLFPGRGTVTQVLRMDHLPARLAPFPRPVQILLMWVWDAVFLGGSRYYTMDGYAGGFGAQWLYLMFPAALLFALHAYRRDREMFWVVVVPLAAMFALQPSNWWTRYTIVFVALGAVGLAYWFQRWEARHPRRVRWLKVFCVVVTAVSTALTFPSPGPRELARALSLPASQRTYARVISSDYAVVDASPPGTCFAMMGSRDTADTLLYPLFGPRLQNRVAFLVADSAPALQRQMRASGARYLFVGRKWARTRERDLAAGSLHRVVQGDLFAVYEETQPAKRTASRSR